MREKNLEDELKVSDLTLFQKGMILVAVPLLFELVFLGTLAALLQRSEAVAQREAASKKIIFAADRVNRTFFNCAVALYTYTTTDNPQFLKRYEELTQKLPDEINALQVSTQHDAAQKDAIARIEKVARQTSDIFTEIKATLEESAASSAHQMTHFHDMRLELEHSLNLVQKHIEQLTEAETEIVRTTPAVEEKTKQSIEKLLLLGVLANIVLAFALVIFFSQNISKRLLILMDNTDRFARQQDLHPALDGTEEIAQLDRSFHEMVRALNESREKERALEQMKQELIAVVSHDLRAPLTAISLNLSFLKMGGFGELPEKAITAIGSNETQVTRLMRMIQDLLDIEKIKSGTLNLRRDLIQLSNAINLSVDSVSALSEAGKVKVIAASTNASLYADEGAIIRIITNLLSNAIKFSPPGAVVSIEVTEQSEYVELVVKDEGPGIPLEYQELIFERFQQVQESDHKQKKGTGLGLAICKALVLEHKGTIGVKSVEGKGSTFWLRIPKTQQIAEESAQSVEDRQTAT